MYAVELAIRVAADVVARVKSDVVPVSVYEFIIGNGRSGLWNIEMK